MERLFLLLPALLAIVTPLTLRDLTQPGENTFLFDILSASVANDYANQNVQFDSEVDNMEMDEVVPTIDQINRNYSDILFEGDIRVSPEMLKDIVQSATDLSGKRKRQAYRDGSFPAMVWSGGVPYSFGNIHPAGRKAAIRSMVFWQQNTCVRFRPRKKEKVFLHYVADGGCWSSIGRDASQRKQLISIGRGCEPLGIASHEVAHALGLFHEQSRYDRNNHITVLARRIPRGLMYNFAMVGPRQLRTYGYPYDVGSVMHYSPVEFSTISNQASLIAKDANLQQTMGSLTGPSFIDIALINKQYACHTRCRTLKNCRQGGYTDPNNCGRCKCPDGFGGRLCERREPSTVAGCGGVIRVAKQTRRMRLRIRGRPGYQADRPRKCVWHLKAPTNVRIMIELTHVAAKCVHGCGRSAVELKLRRDRRPVGYRFCCKGKRRFISSTDRVPLTLFGITEAAEVHILYKLYYGGPRHFHLFQEDSNPTLVEEEGGEGFEEGSDAEQIIDQLAFNETDTQKTSSNSTEFDLDIESSKDDPEEMFETEEEDIDEGDMDAPEQPATAVPAGRAGEQSATPEEDSEQDMERFLINAAEEAELLGEKVPQDEEDLPPGGEEEEEEKEEVYEGDDEATETFDGETEQGEEEGTGEGEGEGVEEIDPTAPEEGTVDVVEEKSATVEEVEQKKFDNNELFKRTVNPYGFMGSVAYAGKVKLTPEILGKK